MTQAPVVLFVYNRVNHTRQTVESLRNNTLASNTDLIIYSDAARTPAAENDVDAVRVYLNSITGFKSIFIHKSKSNKGLARSIIEGVTSIVEVFGRAIVLEDDMITSPHFLTYMNDALDTYVDDERVISAHGYVYPVNEPLPEAFFLPGADCWGWATWKRGWDLFNPNGHELMTQLKEHNLLKALDFDGTYPYSKMLQEQIDGRNQSWAIRWYASALLAQKLTLYPGRSLVRNIGNDGSGSHCGDSEELDVDVSFTPIDLSGIKVEASQQAYEAFKIFFRMQRKNILIRILNKFNSLLKIKY
jgi:hypothetical protein